MDNGLKGLEAVLAIARRGSFRAAALDLGMSTTSLSHTIARLEATVGVRLFNRTTRSVSLSDAGRVFVDRIAPALAEVRGAMETVQSQRLTPSGLLRINASVQAGRRGGSDRGAGPPDAGRGCDCPYSRLGRRRHRILHRAGRVG